MEGNKSVIRRVPEVINSKKAKKSEKMATEAIENSMWCEQNTNVKLRNFKLC